MSRVSTGTAFAIELPADLLQQARRGEPAAQERLYRLFERPVYTLALRLLGDRGEAEDALQDALFKALSRLDDFRGGAPFWGWLRQIAVNEALMRLRRRRATEDFDSLPEAALEAPGTGLPLAALEAAELHRALAALPAITRSVLWLYHAEGYTHEEIAALMQRSVSFSKSQAMRGLRRLRDLLDSRAEARCHA
jgi:RNA polymerase sigma factor (sigma-70 family)